MPFINVKVAGPPLDHDQISCIQGRMTALTASVLRKQVAQTTVLVEQVSVAGWSVGAEPVDVAAKVDAIVSAGTNTPEEKARFIAEVNNVLRAVLGSDLPNATHVIIHDVPEESWGYGGLAQVHGARNTNPQHRPIAPRAS